MKKILSLVMLSCITLATVAAPWDLKSPKVDVQKWTQPFTDPQIVQTYVVKDGDELTINIILDYALERSMYAKVWVRTYRTWGFPPAWGWVWSAHTIEMPYDGSSNHYAEEFPINSAWQYEGHEGSNGTWIVNQDQINVSEYAPL